MKLHGGLRALRRYRRFARTPTTALRRCGFICVRSRKPACNEPMYGLDGNFARATIQKTLKLAGVEQLIAVRVTAPQHAPRIAGPDQQWLGNFGDV